MLLLGACVSILGIIFIIGGLSAKSLSGFVCFLIGIWLCWSGSQGKKVARKKEVDQAVREAMDKRERK
jgi:hypothetical protein